MKRNSYFFVILLVISGFAVQAQTPRIDFGHKGLYPEGTVFNSKNNLFYVGSVTDGRIGSVDMQGQDKVIYEDKNLKSTYGMKIDPKTDRLWVCVSDANYSEHSEPATFKKMGRVIALDLKSGRKVADIDLSNLYAGPHFINDLILDNAGNIYVTDSFSPVIYKIDKNNKASIFAQSDLFKGEDVALNGIAWHHDGYLLVDVGSQGALYKVMINDPRQISKVKTDQLFPGADGLLLNTDGSLTLVQNKSVDKIFQLISTDNWASAKTKAATSGADRFQQPSTGTVANGQTYILNSKMNELADPVKRPSPAFSLQVAEFRPVQ
ncbi:MAG: gluconolaconase [Mucilaginibacter sp.]|nr:gluconolaconase [Mucilaginibacter sp.]